MPSGSPRSPRRKRFGESRHETAGRAANLLPKLERSTTTGRAPFACDHAADAGPVLGGDRHVFPAMLSRQHHDGIAGGGAVAARHEIPHHPPSGNHDPPKPRAPISSSSSTKPLPRAMVLPEPAVPPTIAIRSIEGVVGRGCPAEMPVPGFRPPQPYNVAPLSFSGPLNYIHFV